MHWSLAYRGKGSASRIEELLPRLRQNSAGLTFNSISTSKVNQISSFAYVLNAGFLS